MKFLVSAGIIVFRMRDSVREYLVLHYISGHWDFAKGKIEQGESKQEAAMRELEEEASISARIFDGFEEHLSYVFKEQGELTKKTVYFFVGEADGDQIVLSREHQNYAWLSYEQAREKVTFDNARLLLEKADTFLNRRCG